MTQVDGAGLSLFDAGVYLFRVLEDKSPLHVFLADSKQFDTLYEVVAEEAVEISLDGSPFGFRFFWEGSGQVLPDYADSVSEKVVEQIVHDVGDEVVYPQRQQREQIECGIDETIQYFHPNDFNP